MLSSRQLSCSDEKGNKRIGERAGQGGKQYSVGVKSFIPVLPDMGDPDIPHKAQCSIRSGSSCWKEMAC